MNQSAERPGSGFIQPAITLVNFVVTKVDYYLPPGQEAAPDSEVSISHRVVFDPGLDRGFMVQLQAKVKALVDGEFKLDVEAVALFATDKPIDDDFKRHQLPNVNAVAMAFPFLRSFMASFTVNAGVPRMLLPSVNFHRTHHSTVSNPKPREKGDNDPSEGNK
jgi:preprotein translocase subunit SecB